MLNHEAEANSLTEMEMQTEMRQSLRDGYLHTSLKYLSTRRQFHRTVSLLVGWGPKRDFSYGLVRRRQKCL